MRIPLPDLSQFANSDSVKSSAGQAKSALDPIVQRMMEDSAPGENPEDLAPRHQHIINSIAQQAKNSTNQSKTMLALASQGYGIKEQATEYVANLTKSAAVEFTMNNMGLTDLEFQDKLSGHEGQKSFETQEAEQVEALSKQFGSDIAQSLLNGNVDPSTITQNVIPRMDRTQLDRAISVFNSLLQQAPKLPENSEQARLNKWQLLAVALTATLSPRHSESVWMAPELFLQQENQRRQRQEAERFNLENRQYMDRLNMAGDIVKAEADLAESNYRSDVSLFNAMERERGLGMRATQNNATKLTISQQKYLQDLIKEWADPQTSQDAQMGLRQEIYRLTGMDIALGEEPVKRYIETNKEASTNNLNARTVLTDLQSEHQRIKNFFEPLIKQGQIKLNDERIRQMAATTMLLPAKFDLERMKTLAQIEDMQNDNALNSAKFNFEQKEAVASLAMETATELRTEVKNLRSHSEELQQQLQFYAEGEPQYDSIIAQLKTVNSKIAMGEALALHWEAQGQSLSTKEFAPGRVSGTTSTTNLDLPNRTNVPDYKPGQTSIPNSYLKPTGSYTKDGPDKTAMAQFMASKAVEAGLPPELPVIVGLVESRISNITFGDRDSIGIYQQRGNWGSKEDRLNPEKATEKFIQAAKAQAQKTSFIHQYGGRLADGGKTRKYNFDKPIIEEINEAKAKGDSKRYKELVGVLAQATQKSAFGDRYAENFDNATKLIGAQPVPPKSQTGPKTQSTASNPDHADVFGKSFNLPTNSLDQFLMVQRMAGSQKGWTEVKDRLQKGDYLFVIDDLDNAKVRTLLVESFNPLTGEAILRGGSNRIKKVIGPDMQAYAYRRTA